MILNNIDRLAELREQHKDKRIVLVTGGFDITHAGHVLFFEDAKKNGDILMVGMAPDDVRRREKGSDRPILNQFIRLKMVSSLKPVDYAFLIPDAGTLNLPDHLIPVFSALKPAVYITNNDARNADDVRNIFRKLGLDTEIKILKRWCPKEFENISTTKIIEKIKKLKD